LRLAGLQCECHHRRSLIARAGPLAQYLPQQKGNPLSIKIMSAVWESGPPDKAEILVLLAIADYCNDDGECWPAVSSIARKARMTERGVQKISARLCEIGWLEIDYRMGRKGCNLYRITPNPIHPERGSPRTPEHETPNPVPKNPEPRSPEPLRTIKEPLVSNSARDIEAELCKWASRDAARSFIDYRRKLRKPLTLTAAKRQADQLCQIFQAGCDVDDALGLAEEKGWQSIKADWYFKAKEQDNARQSINGSRNRTSQGHQNGPDPTLERLARLAGVVQAPSDGGF